MAALVGQTDHAPSHKISAGQRVGTGHDLLGRARADHLATVLASTRAHIDHVVRGANRILVMLNHDHGVANVTQALQRGDQALVIALVQANRRLVQNVEHAHKTGSDLRRQTDALGFAARKRGRSTVERQVIETHVHQKAQALHDFFHDAAANELLTFR